MCGDEVVAIVIMCKILKIHVRTHMQRPVREALAKTPAHARARRDADAFADVSARANRTK